MPSYCGEKYKVKTLGDLRRFVKEFDKLEDDYEISFWESGILGGMEIIITGYVDVSYSEKAIGVDIEIKEDL